MNDILNIMPIELVNILNLIFSPLVAIDPNPQNPALSILIIAFIVSLISNLATRYLGNPQRVEEIKNEMKELQKSKNNSEEILKLQSEMMMNTLKPMIITYLPIILMISWMQTSAIHNCIIVLPKVIYWITLTPLWHSIGHLVYGGEATIPFAVGWFLWYMICSFAAGQILGKFIGKNNITLKNEN